MSIISTPELTKTSLSGGRGQLPRMTEWSPRFFAGLKSTTSSGPKFRLGERFFSEIRGAGPCRGGAHTLRGCVRWSPTCRMRAWRAWRLPGRWQDRGRRSTVARWTRRRAVPAYAPIPDLLQWLQESTCNQIPICHYTRWTNCKPNWTS